jgi:deoxyribose-phosphate aldolase
VYLEYCNYNRAFIENKDEYIGEIYSAISLGFSGLSIPLHILRELNRELRGIPINVSTDIDYPTGTSDAKVRLHESLTSLRAGAKSVDLVLNPFLSNNEEYYKILKELETHCRACDDYGAKLRAILHHNLYDLTRCVSLARVVEDSGCEYIIPSSGFHNDDIYDNLLTSKTIESKTDIKVISNGYIWLKKQYEAAINSNIFGLRLYSLGPMLNF